MPLFSPLSKKWAYFRKLASTSVQKVRLIISADGLFLKLEDTETLGLKIDVGLDKPNNGVVIAPSVQKMGLSWSETKKLEYFDF